MKILISSVLFVPLALFTGCASTDLLVTDDTPRTPTTRLEVLEDAKLIPATAKQIADVTFLGPAQDELRARRYFITQAQKLGGNAILCWKTTAQATGDGFGQSWHTEYKYMYHAKILVYDKP